MAQYWEFQEVLVERVIDGDTFEIFFESSPEEDFKRRKLRLFNVNCPEKRGETREVGLMITDYVKALIEGKRITIVCYYNDSFGRWIGDAYADRLNVSMDLLEKGFAVVDKR